MPEIDKNIQYISKFILFFFILLILFVCFIACKPPQYIRDFSFLEKTKSIIFYISNIIHKYFLIFKPEFQKFKTYFLEALRVYINS